MGMNETNTFEELIVMRSKSGDGTIYRQRPLVRCKDCKYRIDIACSMTVIKDGILESYAKDDWFCADGKKK